MITRKIQKIASQAGFFFLFSLHNLTLPAQQCTIKSIPGSATFQNGYCVITPLDTFFPKTNILEAEINIVLPTGYTNGNARYPVLYFLNEKIQGTYPDSGSNFVANNFWENQKSKSLLVIVNYKLNDLSLHPDVFRDSVITYVYGIKSIIDRHLNTRKESESTVIGGYGEGAAIALKAVLELPEVYGKAGIFSAVIKDETSFVKDAESLNVKYKNKIFFYNQANEKAESLEKLERITDIIGLQTSVMIYKIMDQKADVKEDNWKKWYPEFLLWIYANGYNYVLKEVD